MASVIDLSRYQAGISLAAIARDGHAAVIIKATQGSGYVSPTLAGQVSAARAAGLPVGLYHFCDGSDPAAQARHFLAVAGPLVRKGAEPLIFDFEGNGATHAGLDVMRRAVRAAGHRTATYTGGYWDTAGSSGCRECADDPLWLAAYRSTQPAPKRPWTRVALWQRTDAARVTGWAAGVDMSTTDDLSALFGAHTTPTPEDDMPLSQDDVNRAADAVWQKPQPDFFNGAPPKQVLQDARRDAATALAMIGALAANDTRLEQALTKLALPAGITAEALAKALLDELAAGK